MASSSFFIHMVFRLGAIDGKEPQLVIYKMPYPALVPQWCFFFLFPQSRTRAFDMAPDSPVHGGPRLGLVPLPLVWRLAFCRPGVDGGNLLLESGVGQAVALEGAEALELGRDNEASECLAAAAYEPAQLAFFFLGGGQEWEVEVVARCRTACCR